MKSKPVFAAIALSLAALLAAAGSLPAAEPPAKLVPDKISDPHQELLGTFYHASLEHDLAKMKTAYAELQASAPHHDRLPALAFEIAMAEKDWAGMKRILEAAPAGALRESLVKSSARAIMTDQWKGAPKDLIEVVAKDLEELLQATKETTGGDHLAACIVQWQAGNRDKATEHARRSLQLAEETKQPAPVRAAAKRFLERVEGGSLPSMMEFAVWAQGNVSDEAPAPDEGFDAAAHIGKPVEIKFTAADGSGVDLAKLKGKVVLIDFWATWCGPCVAEIPHVKEAYQKYHDKGFEVIGISFEGADSKEMMMKFTKDKGMPWPQYYDGKSWNNAFGRKFSITAIPAMWLIDKDGNLTETNARENLAEKVAKLLGSPSE